MTCLSQPQTRALYFPASPHYIQREDLLFVVSLSLLCEVSDGPAVSQGLVFPPGSPGDSCSLIFHSNIIWLFPVVLEFITSSCKLPVTLSALCDQVPALFLVYSIWGNSNMLPCLLRPFPLMVGTAWILHRLWGLGAQKSCRACSSGPGPRFPQQQAPLRPLSSGQLPGGPGSSGEGKVEGQSQSLLIKQQIHVCDNEQNWGENIIAAELLATKNLQQK